MTITMTANTRREDARKPVQTQLDLGRPAVAVPGGADLRFCKAGVRGSIPLGATHERARYVSGRRRLPRPLLVPSPGIARISGEASQLTFAVRLIRHGAEVVVGRRRRHGRRGARLVGPAGDAPRPR